MGKITHATDYPEQETTLDHCGVALYNASKTGQSTGCTSTIPVETITSSDFEDIERA
jgi:hypothetical protein